MANSAMATTMKSMPPLRWRFPPVYRVTPLAASVPTVDSQSPKSAAITALVVDPVVRVATSSRASSISRKYSAAPKLIASRANNGDRNVSATMETVPARNDPIAAVNSAGPARPRRAIS